MNRFITGEARSQATLFPERIDDYIDEENPVRVVDVFVDSIDLPVLGFKTIPAATGRPSYHPSTMLKLFIYGYLNRIQSSRRLEREAGRNVELMWLLGRLAPDFKTIADFRKNNGKGIRKVCGEFVQICRKLNLFTDAYVAIDGSKFKGVNTRDKNFTKAKIKRRLEQIDESIARYLGQIASAGEYECPAGERLIWRFTTQEHGKTINRYASSRCPNCSMKKQCTTGTYRRVTRWEHEDVLDEVEARIDREPERMVVRRSTVEHPFGTIKSWMGSTHFQMKTLKHVSTEMSLHVLACNLKRMIKIMGIVPFINTMRA
ncbi:transposase [Neptunomonas qingdaonensis]|uniref:Transposase n=1 Tax=Neptunomonas qingdaonensis TaxID=1045558 RepID=A0A1I2PV65_9GAMM|nr:transposase [Neptunomonas qingdaonensis]SFG20165.1 Transposase [Neptunomonas qingdaonensis]